MRLISILLSGVVLALAGCSGADAPALHDTTDAAPAPGAAAAAGIGEEQTLHVGSSSIDADIAPAAFAASQTQILDWVKTGAKGVSQYYGRFPVPQVTIRVTPEGDDDRIHGTEYDGELIRMRIGLAAGGPALADDWTMTHEMLHLAFPNMGQEHLWMNEGLSVYLEPICRARLGIVTPKRYWRELIEGLANGQPEHGDGGLDRTHTWGRTYWGGTMFWFLVDAEIREQTQGKKSIRDVVQKILDAGGDGSVHWPMQRVLDMGDQVSGTHVMQDVYNELALKSTTMDFNPWWQKLGVIYNHGDVQFDDHAPLAWMRNAMIAPDTKP